MMRAGPTRRVGGMSLRTKLIVLFAALLLAIAVFILLFFPARMQSQAARAARNRGVAIANVLAAAASPALDFDDAVNAGHLLEWLASTPEATWASLDRPDGSRLAVWHPERIPRASAPAIGEVVTTMDELSLRVTTPVRGLGGVTGTLSVGFSLDELAAEKRRAQAAVAAACAGVFVVGLLLCALIGTVVVAPIQRVTDAALAIARGRADAAADLPVNAPGEVGVMSEALDLMLRRLREQQTILASQSEASVEGILIVSPARGVISFNRRFLELWQIDDGRMGHLDTVAEAVAPKTRDPAEAHALFRHDAAERAAGEPRGLSGELALADGRTLAYYMAPVTSPSGERFGGGYYFRDVSQEKRAAEEIREMHARLVAASRQAGMAEVATGMLHNVGNVLNSINVSALLLGEQLGKSRLPSVKKAGELMSELTRDHALGLASHPRASRLAPFLLELGGVLEAERRRLLRELDCLVKNVEHVKQIVSLQNAYAKGGGLVETARIGDVVEDAIGVHARHLVRHDIEIVREIDDVPPSALDRHRILQILLNLLANAKHALSDNQGPMRLRISVGRCAPDRLRVVVADNGVGIARENLLRIFAAGVSTRRDGHGFGLHTAAIAAREIGGSLTCDSDGPGTGASFTLELPFLPAKEAHA